jgi:hypothetical protein
MALPTVQSLMCHVIVGRSRYCRLLSSWEVPHLLRPTAIIHGQPLLALIERPKLQQCLNPGLMQFWYNDLADIAVVGLSMP